MIIKMYAGPGVSAPWSGRSRTSMRPGVGVGCGVRGHEQVRKRVLIQAAGFNLGLLLQT